MDVWGFGVGEYPVGRLLGKARWWGLGAERYWGPNWYWGRRLGLGAFGVTVFECRYRLCEGGRGGTLRTRRLGFSYRTLGCWGETLVEF